jgi:hypothetical protein
MWAQLGLSEDYAGDETGRYLFLSPRSPISALRPHTLMATTPARERVGLIQPSRELHTSSLSSRSAANNTYTVAVLRGDSNVKGTVTFTQESESAPTQISWDITGHDANAERGMHVHAFGDNTNGCTSAGPHCTLHLHPREAKNADGITQSTPTTRPTAPPPTTSATLATWATSRQTARVTRRAASRTS